MEQSERRIGEPYLLTDPLIGDVINGIRNNGFHSLSSYDMTAKCVHWYGLLYKYEREIEEDDTKVTNLTILYSNINSLKELLIDYHERLDECLEKGKNIPQNPLDKQLYLIDEERLLKDMPFLKENADILERKLKENYLFEAPVPVEEEFTPVKSYLQAIRDLARIFTSYRVSVGNAAMFVAFKQHEALKAKISDFSPRANTAKCCEAAKSLSTYFRPKETFIMLDKSMQIDYLQIIYGGILTETDNNDYSDRETKIQDGEVRNALSTLVEYYEPKDNWWKDLALHNNKLAKCKVLATITNCKYESIRNFSKKKEGESGKIKEALFGK